MSKIGPFFIFFQIWWIKKMPRAKKVLNLKNHFFHDCQPREGIFDIFSHQCHVFTITCQSFKQLPVIQFWELISKIEILRTISCIYFMKIWVRACFVTTGGSLLYIHNTFELSMHENGQAMMLACMSMLFEWSDDLKV